MKPLVAAPERLGTLSMEDALDGLQERGAPVVVVRGAASLPLPPHVRRAVCDALDEHAARAPTAGLPELREAIAACLDVEADHVLVTHGAMHALSVTWRTLLEPGGEVVMPSPAFYFGGAIELAGGTPVYVPSSESDGWRWDLDGIVRAIGPRTRAVLLCNPTNPTGYLPTRADLAALVELTDARGLLLVVDESYERYVYDGRSTVSVLAVAGDASHVVLVRSMSKSFAMSSWRVGFLVAAPHVVAACRTLLEWDCLRCGTVVQRAAAAAVAGPQDWLAGIAPAYARARDRAFAAVQGTSTLSCVRPQAGPFLFVSVGGAHEQLLEAGLPVVDGRHFQAPGYARLPFGGDDAALDAFERVLDRF